MRPHSWWPGRRVAPLLTAVAFALSAGLGAEAGAWERCGPRICGGQDRCCNASCGICAPPGGACIQPHCGWEADEAGGHAPLRDPRGISAFASPALTLTGGYLPEATPVQELVSCQRSNVSQGVARRAQFIGT